MVDHTSSFSARTDRPIRVLKFGGTSVGTAGHLRRAVCIIRAAAAHCRPVIVVSAAAGVTDELVRAAALADAGSRVQAEDAASLYAQDPTKNDDARRLSHIPMTRARNWTKEGQLGLHSRALDPLTAANIPVHVRCVHRPDAPGTRIVPALSGTTR